MAIISWLMKYKTEVLAIILVIAIAGLSVYAYKYAYNKINPPQTVTTMTQEQAETPSEVKQAADNAKVPITSEQSKEIVTQIKEIHTTEQVPVYIVQSSGATVKEDSDKAVKDNDADFAIVTSKDDPDKKVELLEIKKDTPVVLEQFNVQAYKKVLRQIEVGRSNTGDSEVGFSISKKISKDGQYLGVGISDEWNNTENKVWAKIIYTW